jgi:hypothetical protein
MKKVNNSSLPAIIKSESTNLEPLEKVEKSKEGPIWLNPGPTFPTQVITEEMVVIKSNPLREMIRDPPKITEIYRKI